MSKVVLKGYYGFGNFGDDILMLATYQVCKNIFPKSELLISTESQDHSYINRLLPEIRIVNSNTDIEADWIVHGGGGVFFDFRNGNTKNTLINYFIKVIGYRNYSNIFKLYKSLKGNKYLRSTYRAGLGIGVGTYTPSSNRFVADILALSSFNILLVRDKESVSNASKYCNAIKIHKATDLAFILDYRKLSERKKTLNSKSVGFILRDWPTGNYVSEFLAVAKKFQSTGIDVKFFSFDERADSKYISAASTVAIVHSWSPETMTVGDFLSELETCQLIISSRAHGAIVSTCLGIPTLCVGIEPKLFQVANMLQNSANLIEQPFEEGKILKTIQNALDQITFLEKATHLDVANNQKEMSDGLSLFQTFVRSLTT